jgi:hypothetical protein
MKKLACLISTVGGLTFLFPLITQAEESATTTFSQYGQASIMFNWLMILSGIIIGFIFVVLSRLRGL